MKRLAWIHSSRPGLAERHCRELLLERIGRDYEVFPCSVSEAASVLERSEVALLHLEDGPEVAALEALVSKRPSIVWFHDVLLPSYQAMGKPPFPLRAMRDASVVIVSNERNGHEYAKAARADGISISPAQSALLPYPVELRARSQKLSPCAAPRRILFYGAPSLESRAHVVLEALREAGQGQSFSWMLEEEQYEAASLLCLEYGCIDAKLYTPSSSSLWETLLADADIALHLHHSAFGDPGPLLPLSMASGVLSVVSDFSSTASLPSSVVIKVQAGMDEIDTLQTIFRGTHPLFKGEREAVSDYVAEHHDLETTSASLRMLLEAVCGAPAVGQAV